MIIGTALAVGRREVAMQLGICIMSCLVVALALGCGAPTNSNPAPPTTKTVDAGTSLDALPPVPPSPLPDARRIPER